MLARAIAMLCVPLALLLPSAALADAIDGHWCHKDGRRMTIDGPGIVTPGGTAMTGDYDRHGFAYVIPPGEPGAGKRVDMQLIDEYTVILRTGPDSAKAVEQVWKRCAKPMA